MTTLIDSAPARIVKYLRVQETGGGRIMSNTRWFGLLLVVFSLLCWKPGGAATAQDRDPAFDAVVVQPRGLPQLPPQGAWGEVINVTPRWLVIQNHSGQQFPIAVDDIQEFLIRWPTSQDALTEQSVVEAVGQDVGSNTLRTGHVDVFEGSDQTLVAPTYNSVLPNNMVVTTLDPGFNRFMNAFDVAGQNMLYGWAYPVAPGLTGIPARLHVVGPWVANGPLRVAVPGNNLAAVVPDESGQITMTRVTRGDPRYARKGDYAFLLPVQTTPRGLVVSQLVLYKQIRFQQFNPNR
jgi:hypothetical protein